MKAIDYDEVYAYLSENNIENIESLMVDIENDQLIGEYSFTLRGLMKNIQARQKVKKLPKKLESRANLINPIRI